ncbi:DUF1611 domain-containing protein [Geothermobacter hydrogeniphilus]|uniref:EBNA-1 nuclear protein n=1 Tax=Geothermobacter hydrogeniphilus TaxID=1969733 RepID=A0A1X0YA76_9BACT|nr:DUF1611 domain-containing protein [Geothermobacter hydrogeniphilus]ORJ62026.1 EBNA-1 nuclear protein [Geothermobacter hydrogeniphilus]
MLLVPSVVPLKAPESTIKFVAKNHEVKSVPLRATENDSRVATAIVYCEANFGEIDGKTANGLIRRSEKYKILSVIDSKKAGLDTGMVLDNKPNAIPVCRDLADSLAQAGSVPDFFIFGMAPASGMLSKYERGLVLEAMSHGMNIVNGLHEFLNDDPVFAAACIAGKVEIIDIRKPRDKKDLNLFSGRIAEVTCPVIAVLGTDCAIGKRTTAGIITSALNEAGIKTVMIGTGQTGLIQGARYGVALDAVPSQFCAGELEATVVKAFENESPDVIVVEGQGALSHPAFSSTSFILRGCCPDGVVLQHAPRRSERCDFEKMPMPTPASEINLIETFSDTKIIGLTINHEQMSDPEVSAAITRYEQELNIPVTDALTRPSERLVEMVLAAFPLLKDKQAADA